LSQCYLKPHDLLLNVSLHLDTRLLAVNTVTLDLHEYYFAGPSRIMESSKCGNLLQKPICDLTKVFNFGSRRNLHALQIQAIYDNWPPYCSAPKANGDQPAGIMVEVLNSIAAPCVLNLTVV